MFYTSVISPVTAQRENRDIRWNILTWGLWSKDVEVTVKSDEKVYAGVCMCMCNSDVLESESPAAACLTSFHSHCIKYCSRGTTKMAPTVCGMVKCRRKSKSNFSDGYHRGILIIYAISHSI